MGTITGTTGADTLLGGPGADVVLGSWGADRLDGGAEDDTLHGGIGNDVLFGGSWADTADGGWGLDRLEGGAGDDVYWVDADVDGLGQPIRADVVVEAAGGGIDTVYATGEHRLAANVENLVMLRVSGAVFPYDQVTGVGNALGNRMTGTQGTDSLDGREGHDTLLGGGGNDALAGGSGNDVLSGGLGVDFMTGGDGDDTLYGGMDVRGAPVWFDFPMDYLYGGGGNDTYHVWHHAEIGAISGDDPGHDTVIVHTDLAGFFGNAEAIVLMGSATRANGNVRDNTMTGNALANVLQGSEGQDTLHGAGGNDTLWGEEGHDRIHGGAGDDGLRGGIGNDTLDGGGGVDRMEGGAGDDRYHVDVAGDAVIDAGGIDEGGVDTVAASAAHNLSAGVENLVMVGPRGLYGAGNALANRVTGTAWDDRLHGLAGDDVLLGGGGADLVTGGAGSDTLDGGVGADRLHGGTGGDVYVVDQAGDVVAEGPDAGADVVLASASHTLSAFVEDLELRGLARLNGVGNAGGNLLVGNGGANVLAGLDGDDRLAGAGGDDTLWGGAGADEFFFERGRDVARDFARGVDLIVVDDALLDGRSPTTQVMLSYARIVGTDAVFDFGGGDVLTVRGVTSLRDLAADLSWF